MKINVADYRLRREYLALKGINESILAKEFSVKETTAKGWLKRNNRFLPLQVMLYLAKVSHSNIEYLLTMNDTERANETYEPTLCLKKILSEKGISRADFARMTSMSSQAIYFYEEEKIKDPPLPALITMADALGVSIDYLLGLTSYENWHIAALEDNPFYDAKPETAIYISSPQVSGYFILMKDKMTLLDASGKISNIKDEIYKDALVTLFEHKGGHND